MYLIQFQLNLQTAACKISISTLKIAQKNGRSSNDGDTTPQDLVRQIRTRRLVLPIPFYQKRGSTRNGISPGF